VSKYDIADYLDNDEMWPYLDLAFESGDLSRIATAWHVAPRHDKIARATGLSRENFTDPERRR